MIFKIIFYILNVVGWPPSKASSEFYIYLLTIIPSVFLIFAVCFLLWHYFKKKEEEVIEIAETELNIEPTQSGKLKTKK